MTSTDRPIKLVADAVFTAAPGQPLIQDGAVLVEGGHVVDVGVASSIDAPDATEVKTSGVLMPGLLDLHTHVCLNAGTNPGKEVADESVATTAAKAVKNLSRHLDVGVTTIRDVGGKAGIDIDLGKMVQAGELEGPEVFPAGNVLCITGGHACFLGLECDGVAAMTQGARLQLKRGARLIKLIATGGVITPGVRPGAQQLTEDEMRAACDVAHRADKRVAAHAQGAEGILAALHAGVDTIEHGFWLTDDAIAFMVEHDRTLVPTFAALRTMEAMRDALPAFIQEKLDAVGPAQRKSFAAAHAAGVRLACGTDAGTPGNPHGNIREELAAFIDEGVSVEHTWRAATSLAAEALGQDDRGVLAPSRRADVIAIDRSVFDAPATLARPNFVMQGGTFVRPPAQTCA